MIVDWPGPAVSWGLGGTRYPYTADTKGEVFSRVAREGERAVARAAAAKSRPVLPRAAEDDYLALLEGRAAVAKALVDRYVLRYLPAAEDSERRADAAPDLQRALLTLQALRAWFTRVPESADAPGIRYVGTAVEEYGGVNAAISLSRLLNVPLATYAPVGKIDAWGKANAYLIGSVPTQYLDEVASLVRGRLSSGQQLGKLRDEIQGRYGVAKSRANLIARDQTGKLVASVVRERHESLGITRYRWDTSGDERVRQDHALLDGRIFEYADPPVADRRTGLRGNPGEVWQCRCRAQPIMPGDSGDKQVAEAKARKERELVRLGQSPTVRGEIPNRSGYSDWNRKRLQALAKFDPEAVGL